MEWYQEKYRNIYDRLKSEGPDYIADTDAGEVRRQELLKRIETLPHPSVVSQWDILEVCKSITEGDLESMNTLVGEEAHSILQELDDNIELLKKQRRPVSESVGHELIAMNEHLAYQSKMLQSLTGGQSVLRQLLDMTLKSNCPSCGNDLETTVNQHQSNPDELVIQCRNPNCSGGNPPSWSVGNII